MITPFNAALSGLAAASKRVAVSANNIANAESTSSVINGQTVQTPYVPQRVHQVSQENGGVLSVVTDLDPATVPVFNPTHVQANANGQVDYPNVDIAAELVNQKIASYDYKANLKTIQVTDNMQESLLDIFS